MIENGGARLINEFNNSGTVSYTELWKRKLVDLLADFIFERFGLYPTPFQKITVCKATVELFPKLRVKDSKLDGIVRVLSIFFVQT